MSRPILDYSFSPGGPVVSPLIAGQALKCAHCAHNTFVASRGCPAESVRAVLGLPPDKVGVTADVYVCCRCGKTEVFFSVDPATHEVSEHLATTMPATECPKCNMIVRAGEPRCGYCDWTRPPPNPSVGS